jgi:hypothetical protein
MKQNKNEDSESSSGFGTTIGYVLAIYIGLTCIDKYVTSIGFVNKINTELFGSNSNKTDKNNQEGVPIPENGSLGGINDKPFQNDETPQTEPQQNSSNTILCTTCNGAGELSYCSTCNNYGNTHCRRCEGDGYRDGKTCLNCTGNGILICYQCEGNPKHSKCHVCDGTGQTKSIFFECYICNGKKTTECFINSSGVCEQCNNTGFKACDYCDGDGGFYRTVSSKE